MAKVEQTLAKKELRLFILDIDGFFPATLTVLAKNHFHAIRIAERKYPVFVELEENYRVKGPLSLEEGLLSFIDFEGNVLTSDDEINDIIDLVVRYSGCNTCGDGSVKIEVEAEEFDHEERLL